MKRGRKADERIRQLPIDSILSPARDARTTINDEKLKSLQRSIKQLGVLQPILVVERRPGKYEVVAGHRRLIACQANGMATVPARIMKKDEMYDETAKLHENVEREDLSVLDEARSYDYFMKVLKLSQAEVAAKAGKSEGYISQRLSILSAPEIVREALADGVISFSVARELTKITDLNELNRLVVVAAQNGVTPAVARAWRMQWEAAQQMPKGEIEGDIGYREPAPTFDPSTFICGCCKKPESVNRMKIVRVCPQCEIDVTTVAERSEKVDSVK